MLDATGVGRHGVDIGGLTEAGIGLIATDVRSDEDAMALIDLGVTLMCGPRFGGPKRLRPQDDCKAGRLAALRGPRDG